MEHGSNRGGIAGAAPAKALTYDGPSAADAEPRSDVEHAREKLRYSHPVPGFSFVLTPSSRVIDFCW